MTIAQNVMKFYINRAIAALFFAGPIYVLFLLGHGLSMFEVMVLEAIYSVAIIATQVPTGALADIIGRRKTIVVGYGIETVAVLMFTFARDFPIFAIAQVLWGSGISMILTQENSLVFDSLRAIREQKKSKGVFANAFMFALFAGFVGAVIGGYIATTINYESAFFATAAAFAVLCIASVGFVEPAVYKRVRLTWKMYTKQIWSSLKYVLRKFDIALIIVASALTTAILTTYYWFIQPYLVASRVDVVAFGTIYGAIALTAAIAAKFVAKFRARARELIIGLGTTMAATFIAMAFVKEPSISPLLVLIPSAVWGLAAPTYLNFIHKNIPSPKRATISSLEILLSSLFFAIFAPALGHIADAISLSTAFLVLAVFSAAIALFFTVQRLRKLKE